jgi:hypothetical protein
MFELDRGVEFVSVDVAQPGVVDAAFTGEFGINSL